MNISSSLWAAQERATRRALLLLAITVIAGMAGLALLRSQMAGLICGGSKMPEAGITVTGKTFVPLGVGFATGEKVWGTQTSVLYLFDGGTEKISHVTGVAFWGEGLPFGVNYYTDGTMRFGDGYPIGSTGSYLQFWGCELDGSIRFDFAPW